MSVLERLASPLRSRDAAARLRAVKKHPAEDAGTLAELARSDPDARVRREAVRRLEAPRVLLELRETAGDEEARRLARGRSESLLVKIAADDRDLGESERALALLAPLRAIAEVACRARFVSVREQAALRLTGSDEGASEREAALAVVAGRAEDPSLRGRALAAIGSESGLCQVALSGGEREAALAAVRRLEDPELLLRVAGSGAPKSVRRLADRRARERLPPEHPFSLREREAALAERLDRLTEVGPASDDRGTLLAEAEAVAATGPVAAALRDRLEALRRGRERPLDRGRLLVPEPAEPEAPPKPAPVRLPEAAAVLLERLEDEDSILSLAEVEAAEREAERLLPDFRPGAPPRARFEAAVRAARERAFAQRRQRIHEFELAEIGDQAVSLADSLAGSPSGVQLAKGRRELARLNRRFEKLSAAAGAGAERFRAAAARADAALAAGEGAREERTKRSRERVLALERRLEALETAESLALEEVETALRDLGALRGDQDAWRSAGPARQARFQRLQAALLPRLREAREIREWRRWSNLEEQPVLIRRARALLEVEDLRQVDRELGEIERAWHEVRHADRDRGQELWEEWEQVRGQLLERVAPLREDAERTLDGKVNRLRELVARAEELAEAVDPRQAGAMRELMAEWRGPAKGVGKRSAPLWKRFRAANDRYFGEVKAARKAWITELSANIPVREALIARARDIPGSADPDAVRSAVRGLMDEWKAAPPVPRKRGDRLWKEFREVCDAARDRARGGGAPEQAAAAPPSEAETALSARVAEVAALPAGERAHAAEPVWQEYRKLPGPGTAVAAALTEALREAFRRSPESFSGTRFDQEALAERLAALLDRIEPLDQRRSRPGADGDPVGIAAQLQEALGGGRAADAGSELREAAAAARGLLERARAAGPALAEPAAGALRRIEETAKRVIARAPEIPEGRSRERRDRGDRRRGRG